MKQEATTGFLGFENVNDFMGSFIGVKHAVFNASAATIGGLTSFVTDYIWDDPGAVMTLYLIMTGDWISGIIKAIVKKRVSSFKLFRMPLYFVATSYVLSVSWRMAEGNIAFAPLPGTVMFGFYSVYFTSLLENLGEAGLLPPTMVRLLKKFGIRAIVRKYFKTEEGDNSTD